MQLSAGAAIILTVHGTELNKEKLSLAATEEKEETVLDPEAGEEEPSVFSQIFPSICIIAFFNIMPLIFIKTMTNKRFRETLDNEQVKNKIGNMYANVDPKYTGSLYYNVIFLIRRSAYVLITFSLFPYPGI